MPTEPSSPLGVATVSMSELKRACKGKTPKPLRATVWDPSESVPLRLPALLGQKVTLTLQVAPAARDPVQSVVAVYGPLTVSEPTDTDVAPTFWICTVLTADSVLMAWSPKPSAPLDRSSCVKTPRPVMVRPLEEVAVSGLMPEAEYVAVLVGAKVKLTVQDEPGATWPQPLASAVTPALTPTKRLQLAVWVPSLKRATVRVEDDP